MANDRGWSASPSDVLFHKVINWLNAHPDAGPMFPTEAAAKDLGVEPQAVGETFDLMGTIGWGDAKHYAGPAWAMWLYVRPTGSANLREYAERSRARRHQINACTDGMLDWLYEHDGDDVSSLDFADDPRANFLGEPYDVALIRGAARSLCDQGLALGTEMLNGDVLGMAITPAGRDVVDAFDSDLRSWRTRNLAGRQGDVNVNIDGSTGVAVAVHSPDAQQSSTVTTTTDHRTQIIGLADAFEQMLPVLGLSDERVAEARDVIGELRAVGTEDEPDPNRVRRLLEGVKGLAIAGTGNAAGTGIVALVEQIAHHWPF